MGHSHVTICTLTFTDSSWRHRWISKSNQHMENRQRKDRWMDLLCFRDLRKKRHCWCFPDDVGYVGAPEVLWFIKTLANLKLVTCSTTFSPLMFSPEWCVDFAFLKSVIISLFFVCDCWGSGCWLYTLLTVFGLSACKAWFILCNFGPSQTKDDQWWWHLWSWL